MSVIVSGAGAGIGRAVTERLLADGHRVTAVDIDVTALPGDHASGRLTVVQADALDGPRIAELCADTAPISGVVACAGISRPGESATYRRQDWVDIVDLNLYAVFDLMRCAAPHAVTGASFVAISSISSFQGFAGRAAYSASKAGVDGLIRSLSVEYAPAIRVNAVAPGYVRTELVARNLASGAIHESALLQRTPLGRLGEPGDVAGAVSFLLSSDASWITGTTLPVDGGWLATGLGWGER